MSVQYLIKYNLWERNSSSPPVPLCKQDLLFTSSAKILICDQKKGAQIIYCAVDCTQSVTSEAGGDGLIALLL